MKRSTLAILAAYVAAVVLGCSACSQAAPPAAVFTVNGQAQQPAGADVFLRFAQSYAPQVKAITIENVKVSEMESNRRAIQVSGYDSITIRNVEIGPMSLSAAALAAKFHGDGIQHQGSGASVLLIQNVYLHDLGNAISPIHAVDGGGWSQIILDNVRMERCVHPCYIGGKTAKIGKLTIRNSPGVQVALGGLTGEAPVVAWEGNNAGAVVYGQRIAPTTAPTSPAATQPAESSADLKARIADLQAAVAQLRADVALRDGQIVQLKADIARRESDLADLRRRVAEWLAAAPK